MSSTDKNFIRNLCLAAGLFFAFLLVAPVKYGPSTTVLEEKPDHVSEVDSATEVATTTLPAEIMDSSNGLVSATDFLVTSEAIITLNLLPTHTPAYVIDPCDYWK